MVVERGAVTLLRSQSRYHNGTLFMNLSKGDVMRLSERLVLVLLIFVWTLALPLPTLAERASYPEVIQLSDGFQPEGIAAGKGHFFYTGALNGGAIFRFDARTGQVENLVEPQADRSAVGMAFDPRSNLLFVAGGSFGTAYVYDGSIGDDVAVYPLTAPLVGFVNDVVVNREAAYFTDSFQKVFYRIPLGPAGSIPAPSEVETIPLGDDFNFVPGDFNANGIETTSEGDWLLIVSTVFGELYRVDPTTGEAVLVDLGGMSVPNGDGLVLRGLKLYVVQNFLNQISVVDLDTELTAGTIVDILASPYFRIPTTAASFGDALYAVNARFDEIPPGMPGPDDTFEAVRIVIH
jgi:sugar lactone lactonase YvrE